MAVVSISVVIVIVALRQLATQCAEACAGCSPDQCALEAPAEERSQRRSTASPDQRGLSRTDAAVVVMVVPILIIAGVALVIALANSVVHAVVVVTSIVSIVPPVALS
jgi:hypothetical protein